jgi:hypothetical protein
MRPVLVLAALAIGLATNADVPAAPSTGKAVAPPQTPATPPGVPIPYPNRSKAQANDSSVGPK